MKKVQYLKNISSLKGISTLILFILFPVFVNSQTTYKSINEIDIINKSLRLKINEFLSNEKNCTYYSENLIIYINITELKNTRLISFSSSTQTDLILSLSPKGVFTIGNHNIFVGWDKSTNLIKSQKKIRCFKFDSQFYNKLDEQGKMVIIVNDDSFSQWDYLETDGTLVLKNKTSICE